MEDSEELTLLARKYLDLWLEHWASCVSAPETAAAVAKVLGAFAPARGDEIGSINDGGEPTHPGNEPAPLRTAPSLDGGGAGELEKRIAALERRLVELERDDAPAKSPRRARRRPAKV